MRHADVPRSGGVSCFWPVFTIPSVSHRGQTPTQGATIDFELVRTDRFHKEIERERWGVTMQFVFMSVIPQELMPTNPMGLVITYLQGDRAMEVIRP